MLSDIRRRFRESKSERQKQSFCRFLSGRIIRKYKMEKFAEAQLGISQRRWYTGSGFDYKHNSQVNPVHSEIRAFYLRDDNSHMTTRVKNTKILHKMKKQRRLLLDTLINLHGKFLAESKLKVSYSVFCRLRPFWVVEPSDLDRETCLCKKK